MARKQIEGLDKLLKKLEQLDNVAQRRALRRGVTRGAAVVRKKARANAKNLDDKASPHQIFKNITAKAWRFRRGDKVVGSSVGVKGGAKTQKKQVQAGQSGDTWYWRFLEFGTRKQKATPFLAPALKSEENAAVQEIKNGAMKAIDDIAKG